MGGAVVMTLPSEVCGAPAEFVIEWKPEAESQDSLTCGEHLRLLRETANMELVERVRDA